MQSTRKRLPKGIYRYHHQNITLFVSITSLGSVESKLTYTSKVTCMDARIDPAAAFGIELGEAHVIRNAGGSATDSLRSIIISEQLLGTKEILLVKHTDCGMMTFNNDDVHDKVKQSLGELASNEISGHDFLPFQDVEKAVRDDVAFLKSAPTVPKDVLISGWIYELETGKVKQVV